MSRWTSYPLTPNGKVDRKALPAPEEALQSTTKEYSAPRTPTEELLARIWQELLKVERVGISDNFFELGGHSLLATQMISQIQTACQVQIELRIIFESQDLAGFAQHVEAAKSNADGANTVPGIMRVSREQRRRKRGQKVPSH